MQNLQLLIPLIAIPLAIAVALALRTKRQAGSFKARQPVTPNEQAMYWRLTEAFPTPAFIVLAQVSFGALLRATKGASRYSFSQKVADFVVLDKAFQVMAIIELDDSSHKGREQADRSRDTMLTQAGYKVLRYSRTPDAAKLRADLTQQP